MAALRLLIVDDVREHAQMVGEFVRVDEGWPDASIEIAASYEEAIAALTREPFDVAFFDYWLGTRDGLMLLREIRARRIMTPVIMLTGRGAEEIAVESMKAGAADYLSKGNLTVEAVIGAIRHAVALQAEERQRLLAEAALRNSEGRFRALVENSSDVLLLSDAHGRVVYVTPSAARHLAWNTADLRDRSFLDLIHTDDRELMSVTIGDVLRKPGDAVPVEVRVQHGDGTWRSMEGIAVNRLNEPAVGAIAITLRDATERRRLEEQLRQSHKMDAIGRLAGGIAHDFNNLLTAILGYCNLMLDELGDHALRHDLEEIRHAGTRAAQLTRQLLAFSRRQMLQPQTVDVNALVRHTETLLRRLIAEDIELVTNLAADLVAVRVDPASLEQVLMNLAVNARDAMPTGGRLSIETAMVDLDRPVADTPATVVPGRYVMIAIADTGQGMDAETRDRIFEPFFTTKPQGEAAGLGLATVYGIVKQSGGYIWVFSEAGRGTVFRIYLPPATEAALAAPDQASGVIDAQRAWETVLLVEDEDAVRAIAREVLRRHGYVVLEARHGLDALRAAERHQDPIHLLIADLVMPHMTGRELARRLTGARPNMKVLYISGYTNHAVVNRETTPESRVLQKPFTPEDLARSVRRALNE